MVLASRSPTDQRFILVALGILNIHQFGGEYKTHKSPSKCCFNRFKLFCQTYKSKMKTLCSVCFDQTTNQPLTCTDWLFCCLLEMLSRQHANVVQEGR